MSATTGEEWVYVDLGSQSEFDKVKLHWINKRSRVRFKFPMTLNNGLT